MELSIVGTAVLERYNCRASFSLMLASSFSLMETFDFLEKIILTTYYEHLEFASSSSFLRNSKDFNSIFLVCYSFEREIALISASLTEG